MTKLKGFLLLEAILGLFISCMGVMLLSFTLAENKKIENDLELRVDKKMAKYILKNSKENNIIIHDKSYKK